jgi:hypothetical protein
LQGKPFPDRCGQEAWDIALGDFGHGLRSVSMSGSLRYNSSKDSGPLFRFRLQPLRLEDSHRCGRRFGHNRFLEIDMPSLDGRQLPKALEQVGERGPEIISEWLVDGEHWLMDRLWKPFYVKFKNRGKHKVVSSKQSPDGPDPVHRVYFFATDGRGFREGPIRSYMFQPHTRMSIDALLDCIRPTAENAQRNYLKLFARTSLGEFYSYVVP